MLRRIFETSSPAAPGRKNSPRAGSATIASLSQESHSSRVAWTNSAARTYRSAAVQVAAAAEVLPGERVRRGDHVPRGAAAGQMVERGELPGDLVRLVVRRLDRACQPQVPGHRGDRGEHGHRVRPADHVQVVDLAALLAQPQPLGEEEEVEQARLGGPRQVRERGRTRSGCPTPGRSTPCGC